MPLYFSSDQVAVSFKRLTSRKSKGKTPMERTSALMYFLAFDAVIKKTSQTLLDLNPDETLGKENRKFIELEFTRLVLIERTRNNILQVCELGKISKASKSPEKRISSNFLTVPLKKASDQAKPFYYPNRPSAPLIKMGQPSTGLRWGMSHYEEWTVNLPKLLSEIKEPTAFTDLAIFVMRDCKFTISDEENYTDALHKLIKERYTIELSNFWIERIKKEQVFAKHIKNPFKDIHESFIKKMKLTDNNDSSYTEVLEQHINYLEAILIQNSISFKPLTRA